MTVMTSLIKQARQVPRAQRAKPGRSRGWTLIELLMVMAIVAVLASVAWPSYTQHVQRGHRLEAVAALLEAQHFMERYYTTFGRYSVLASSGAAAVAPALPARLQNIPAAGTRYVLSVSQVSANSFTLSAAPVGSMATDKCGSLTFTHTSVRGTTGSGSVTAAECWR